MHDSAPTNDSLQPTQPVPADGDARLLADQFAVGPALLRLMIGGMLVGSDELRYRLRRWDEASRASQTVQEASPRADAASPRHALVGLAFEAEMSMRRGLSSMASRVARLADEANLFYDRVALSALGTPLEPMWREVDDLFSLAQEAVDRWTARGRREEQRGSRLAEQAVASLLDEVFDYMARNPAVRDLIERQGASMADSAVDEVRGRTAAADQWIERLAHNVLHRATGEGPAKLAEPADRSGTPPEAVEAVKVEDQQASTRARKSRSPEAAARTSPAADEVDAAHSGESR